MTTQSRHADAAYTDGLRDLANMDHVSAELAGVLRDCAGVIDSQATALAARSTSPDGLQEPALREALEPDMSWFDIAVDNRGNTVILDYAPGWVDHAIEFYWEDTFASDPPKHLPAGAYRWTDFKIGFWGDSDHINVTGGEFRPQHRASTPPVPHDYGLRDALEALEQVKLATIEGWPAYKIADDAIRALSLPQQAATDEGEKWKEYHPMFSDFAVEHDDGQFTIYTPSGFSVTVYRDGEKLTVCNAPAKGFKTFSASLADLTSTPTSQPPAAETRLRIIEQAACRVLDAIDTCRNSHTEEHQVTAGAELDDATENMRAALTQPEPIAQQGGEASRAVTLYRTLAAWSESEFAVAASGDDGENLLNLIVGVIGDLINPSCPISAQQAAGEAEAVAVQKIETVTGDFMQEPGEPFWRIEINGYCADFDHEEAARNFAAQINALATPQPTETQRIVAWMEKEAADYADGEATSKAASSIIKHLAKRIGSGEHLAGEVK